MQHRYESVKVADCMIAETVLSPGPTSAASPLSVLAAAQCQLCLQLCCALPQHSKPTPDCPSAPRQETARL